MIKIVKIFLPIIVGVLCFICSSVSAAAERPDFGLDEYDYNLPTEVADELEQNGITPESVSIEALSAENVVDYIIKLLIGSLQDPIKLTVSVFAVILLCGIANVLSESAGENMKNIFSLVSVLVGAAMLLTPISAAIAAVGDVVRGGSVFLEGFIPAFAGMMAMSGQVTTAAVINTVVMAGAQIYSLLAANLIVPAASCIMGITIAGSVNPELKLNTIAETAKKIIIWGLGLIMTVFVALLGLQSFITLPADGIAIKTARFTVANGVPFIGGTISEALSVMQGGINIIRNNFGSFGIIAGALLILPSIASTLCSKLALSVCAAASDMFGLTALTGLLKSAESIMSIILAVLVCFMLIAVISVSLMLFIGMGGAV
ncbi:MAG: stage III sporulation protein AE [Eubacterium sp.]|nr:stage III sporulation protein AE [Eubacterium sp.]